jgi:hypothetical protein
MAHIEIIKGKETLVASESIKICMKLEDPKETLLLFKDTKKKLPINDKITSKE